MRLGETLDPVVGELQVVLEALRNLVRGGIDDILGNENVALPLIEFAGVLDGFGFTAFLDLAQHAGDQIAHIGLAGR